MTGPLTASIVWWDQLVPYCPALGVFLADDAISEIEVNPGGEIYIEASGRVLVQTPGFGDDGQMAWRAPGTRGSGCRSVRHSLRE
jgi:hypothetical protein